MKKIVKVLLALAVIFTLVGCKKNEVEIDYGNSSIYSKQDMDEAINVIIKYFNKMDGCELHSLSYTSDELSLDPDNIAWMNELEEANDNKETFTQFIEFESSFRSPKNGGGAWQPNKEYGWVWCLARSDNGKWKLMTWGY